MPRTKATAPPRLRDRIIDLRRLPASALQDHQQNWRVHPQAQRDALQGVLDELGIASALLVYDSPRQGGLCVIDGHLRKSLDPAQEWPCLMLDLDDDEASYLLATHDPLGAMAEASREALAKLLEDVTSGQAAVQQLLSVLAAQEGVVPRDLQPVDYTEEWHDMPAFEAPGTEDYQQIILHFRCAEDVQAFAVLVQQPITDATKYLYFPEQEKQKLAQHAYTT